MQATLGGKRRARGDRAAQPLQAREQRRLLADDVRARAFEDRHVEREARAEDGAAEQAGAPRDRCREVQRRLGARVLRARQHEAVVGADGVGGERHPLEQQLGVLLHQDLVDVRARVALVAVGDDELALAVGVARELPLRARGKARAAAAADVRRLDLLEQLVRLHRRDRARQRRARRDPTRAARARRARCAAAARSPCASASASTRATTSRPASMTSPSRIAGELWQRPRQTVSASETAPSAERSPSSQPKCSRSASTCASAVVAKHAVPVQTRMWRAPRGCSRSS